ncbi:MAG: hypothetical protein E7256_13500 [Lachnospiraceae bacterium]|nr:hypothetical protein [Lachnospiraceae bacterium]
MKRIMIIFLVCIMLAGACTHVVSARLSQMKEEHEKNEYVKECVIKREEERKVSQQSDEKKKKEEAELKEYKDQQIKNCLPGIVCWGDNMTAGVGGNGVSYPSILRELICQDIYDIPVLNMGISGESSLTISARAGSIDFLIDGVTIPATNTPVEIKFKEYNNYEIAPLRQGNTGINPVTINGIKGTLNIKQENNYDGEYQYFFTRTLLGEETIITDGSKLSIASEGLYNDYIPVIYIGQHGGFDDTKDLINQINAIINVHTQQKKYIVLGLTTGTKESRKELEEAMQNAFGDRYINLREILCENGLSDCNMEPTEEDLEYIKIGSIPPSLLADDRYFNSYGYIEIANIIYERMQMLGYFDDVLNILSE